MPSFNSKNGIWEPATERVATVDGNGNPQIYNGPDRAALEAIDKNGGEIGQDATKDPQLLQASRNAGFNTVEEYLKYFEPKPKEAQAIKEAQDKPITHQPEPAKPGVDPSLGGFNDDGTSPMEALETKKRSRGRPKGS